MPRVNRTRYAILGMLMSGPRSGPNHARNELLLKLLAPSNDWPEAQATHARMARLRAIEQGFALVRPTKDGTTLVTDATGRWCGHLTLADNRTGSIVVDVPFAHRWTMYAMIGDAFSWLCVAIFVALCACAAVRALLL